MINHNNHSKNFVCVLPISLIIGVANTFVE